MRINSSLLGWGVFLVALGAVPLAVSQGLVPEETVRGWWRFWPLLLIAGGVALVLRSSALGAVAGLVMAAALGVLAGGALAGGFSGLGAVACGDTRSATPFPTAAGELREGDTVDIEFNCGVLDVQVDEGSIWRLSGSADDGQAPEVGQEGNTLRIRSADGASIGLGRARDVWALTLPDSALGIEAQVNAAQLRLDLAGATLDRLKVGANASDVRVDLADAESVAALEIEVNAGSATVVLPDAALEGRLSANAGSIHLCADPGAALRLRTEDNVTASNNFASRGLRKNGDTWETDGFGSAEEQVVLDLEANAASIELNPDEGCDG